LPSASVCAFVADLFGISLEQGRINYEGATLAALEILRFMETESPEEADCTKPSPSVFPERSMSIVFEYPKAVLRGEFPSDIFLRNIGFLER
jgi:hypothetical protein